MRANEVLVNEMPGVDQTHPGRTANDLDRGDPAARGIGDQAVDRSYTARSEPCARQKAAPADRKASTVQVSHTVPVLGG